MQDPANIRVLPAGKTLIPRLTGRARRSRADLGSSVVTLVRLQGTAPPGPRVGGDLGWVEGHPADRQRRVRRPPVRAVVSDRHELWHWLATTPALVVNRPAPSASNATKPAQMRVASDCGCLVPESLLTNHAQAALAFASRCGQVIYSGAGGSHTVTGLLDPADSRRLAHLATCPTYLQRYIAGSNVRVHVASDAVFAVKVDSDAVDYRRHAHDLRPTRIPETVADRCRAVTRALGLLLAGAGRWCGTSWATRLRVSSSSSRLEMSDFSVSRRRYR